MEEQDQAELMKHDHLQHRHDEHDIEASETDILAKYQERHARRQGYGERERRDSTASTSSHPTCFRESICIICAWLGYFIHIAFILIPSSFFRAKVTTVNFHKQNTLSIQPATWNFVQWGIQLLWQGILLTYLSLIVAEHTVKIFRKSFYYAIGFANLCLAIWDICTQQESNLGRVLSWLIISLTLIYTNYVLLTHMYFTYDVTRFVFPCQFRLDTLQSVGTDSATKGSKTSANVHSEHGVVLPPALNVNSSNRPSKSTQSRNIKSILRIQSSGGGRGGLNSSPLSMSMARMYICSYPCTSSLCYIYVAYVRLYMFCMHALDTASAAEKLVYDAANMVAQTEHDNDWYHTKIMDLTRYKYAGLIGIVFNGTSYFLSIVLLEFWIQFGVWLVWSLHVTDTAASIAALVLALLNILIYYYLDFFYLERYLVDNIATHVVCVITLAAMVWKHVFGDHKDQSYSFTIILQIIMFVMVSGVAVFKIVKTIGIHNRYKRDSLLQQHNDEYIRV